MQLMSMTCKGKEIEKRGRPPNIGAIQLELQEKLYNQPDKHKVTENIYCAALSDSHKNQAAAQKFLMDKMLPISVCDKNADIRKKITINISSVEMPNREEKVINQ